MRYIKILAFLGLFFNCFAMDPANPPSQHSFLSVRPILIPKSIPEKITEFRSDWQKGDSLAPLFGAHLRKNDNLASYFPLFEESNLTVEESEE